MITRKTFFEWVEQYGKDAALQKVGEYLDVHPEELDKVIVYQPKGDGVEGVKATKDLVLSLLEVEIYGKEKNDPRRV